MKRLIYILLIFVLIFSVIGCSNNTGITEDATLNVATLKGPTGMGMVKLMEDNESKENNINYNFTVLGAPDDMIGKITNGEVDIAAVPSNMAAVLYNKTEGEVKLAAINTLGVLYVLENGNEIETVEDLKGKKINASGKGATPDYALSYILKENDIDPMNDVEIDFTLQHSELAAAAASGDVNIALLPQPHVTTAIMKNEDLRIALDMTEEWNKVTEGNSQLAMGCIVVRKEYAENNKEIVDNFLKEYDNSVQWVNENNKEAADLIEKFKILPNAAIAQKALPYSNIVYIDGQEAKDMVDKFIRILYDFNPKSVGGKIPDEGLYY
ncbi:ABC transporter substrate-binding protein [Clostridiisalibacter paucivorans]|uniref:ABC transporter substrate-binding protein n=1 Tax=Clostridiisalibacter paucivorans TaxID=408753 RepID=UPI00047B5524|nr:ABC transporter substrate-binding protein [Clostridiisalibacter paucivorans]